MRGSGLYSLVRGDGFRVKCFRFVGVGLVFDVTAAPYVP